MSDHIEVELESDEAPIPFKPTLAEIERLRAHVDHAAAQAIECFRREECLTEDEIVVVVEELSSDAEHYRARIRNTAPEELKLCDFGMLSMFDPEAGKGELDRFRKMASAEFLEGVGAAKALYGPDGGSFWESETFGQILKQLGTDWVPQCAIERNLLQNIAQAWVLQQRWTAKLSKMEAGLFNRERVEHEMHGGWLPPRVSEQAAMDHAAAMIDRFNRMALRNIRTLRDLRRPIVHIDRANIANQQIVVEAGTR
jgi:hypothetical protein